MDFISLLCLWFNLVNFGYGNGRDRSAPGPIVKTKVCMEQKILQPQSAIIIYGEISFHLGRITRFVRELQFSCEHARARADSNNLSSQSSSRVHHGKNEPSTDLVS